MKKPWIIGGVLLAAVLVAWAIQISSVRTEPTHDGRPLSHWLEDLRAENPVVRTNGAVAIRKIGTNALPHLIQLIETPDSSLSPLKQKANDLLWRQSWIQFRFRRPYERRSDGLRGLAALGPEAKAAIPNVAKLLDQESHSSFAAYVLHLIGSEAVPSLQTALTNKSEATRRHAAGALGLSRSESAVPDLLQMLKAPEFLEKNAAVRALSRFPGQADLIVPAFMDCLDNSDSTFRSNAARALLEFGDNAWPAIPKLLRLVENPDHHVCTTAAGVLMKLDLPGTLVALTNNLASADVVVRRSTAWSLMVFKSAGRPAVPALVKCLQDPDGTVRLNAAVALREIGEEPDLVVPALMANLADPDLKIRSVTGIALRSFGERAKPAVPMLLKLIEENQGDIFTLEPLFDTLMVIDPDAAKKLVGK